MKYLLTLLLCVGFVACSSSEDKPPVADKPPVDDEPNHALGVDPSYQKAPVKIGDTGLPVGECKLIGEKLVWASSMSHKDMRNCSSEAKGKPCSRLGSYCKIDNLKALKCRSETVHSCHGWAFEKVEGSVKPLKDVEAFAFRWMGSESRKVSPSFYSDKNGYYEFETSSIGNQINVKSATHYITCNMGSPMKWTSNSMRSGNPEKLLYPVIFKPLSEADCK